MNRRSAILVAAILWSCSLSSQPWIKSDSLRLVQMINGNYDSALYFAEETAAFVRGTIGENNLQYAPALHNLSVSHFCLGNYNKSKYFILKEASLRESLKSVTNQDYINTLLAASVICRKAGSYEEALVHIKKAEKLVDRIYDKESWRYAEFLEIYAGVYHDFGCSVNDMVYLGQEEKYLKRAAAIYQKLGGSAIRNTIINSTNLAAYNNNIGNSPEAERMLLEVISMCGRAYGPESHWYATALNNLAVHYYNTANYKMAERYLVEAVGIHEESRDTISLHKAVCINNLGALYHDMGNYKLAAKLTTQAQTLFEAARQFENPVYAVLLNNTAASLLAGEYFARPEDKRREQLLQSGNILFKADSVFRLNCRIPHPYDQSIRSNIAIWYNLTGDKKRSAKLLTDLAYDSNMTLRVVSMMKKMSFSGTLPDISDQIALRSPEPVTIPISIKLVDQVSASNAEANTPVESDGLSNAVLRLFLGKATNIKKAVGPYHPAYAEMLKNLIIVYGSVDDVRTEEELTLEYMDVINHKTLQDFSFLAETEKELYYQTRLPDMHSFTAYSLMRKKANPAITGHTYNNILLNKGLMLKSSTAMRLAILNSNDPVILKEYDEWIALQREISALYSTPVELRTKNVAELEKKATSLERSLVTKSQDFNDYRSGLQLTWEDVKNNLKADEAAIEFTDFRRRERDGGDEVIYCALIVRSNSTNPEMIKLFNEDQLKAVIGIGGLSNINDINFVYGSSKSQNDALYNLIWKPMEAYLSDIKNVYISPSGLLHKISFPAISKGKDVYLCDDYRIQVKGSTGSSIGQNLFSTDERPSALVFGGIQYNKNSTGDDVWTYLAGTKKEGDAVNEILSGALVNVSYLTDGNATETYFKQNARKYNILHLATHGFFFDDPNEVRFKEEKPRVEYGDITFRGTSRGFGVNSFVNNENPLMRSGLVLAGANDVWIKTEKGDSEDGVLTAQEVTQIDMRKNDLVVLSACETGLGDIRGTEGVYGLQRSLKMAGVKYIIMSLWEIPDKETVEFMTLFYGNLLKLKDIKEAFHEAQREMRAKYDPYYWGAFVLME
jgi:CHAT domain-containing protein